MSLVSQFFILSPRGDSILFRDFRFDVPKSSAEVFFRNVKFWNGKAQEAPPIFNIDGVSYVYVKKMGLFFVITTRYNTSPSLCVEFLVRITKLFRDYLGVLSEESIRTNFSMLYEVLDEAMDFGYVQGTSTELLKPYIFSEAVVIAKPKGTELKVPDFNPKTTPSTAVDKPISFKDKKAKKNEIFVDIYERVSITFNANGYILNSAIDGMIQMKSYLAGNPELRLALNEELVVGKGAGAGGYGVVELDDCNFHECVKTSDFDASRVLSFVPPDGEFVLMNYRVTGDFRVPFRIFPFFELVSPYKVELIVKVRADLPEHSYGGNVVVCIPVPKSTSSAVCTLSTGVVGQSTEYDAKERKILWKLKRFQGGTEQTLRTKITLGVSHTASVRKEVGPISMEFELPMYNPSGLQVRYLRILENKSYNPYRWVRYVTRASSYVCRM